MANFLRTAPTPANVQARTSGGWRERLRDYLLGAGSVVELLPPPGSGPVTFYRSDVEALAADWRAIGNDMRQAIQVVRSVSPGVRKNREPPDEQAPAIPGSAGRGYKHDPIDAV